MTKMNAVLMHGERGGEGTYMFEIPANPNEMKKSDIIRALMEHLASHYDLGGPMDYDVSAAFRNREHQVLTVIGEMVLDGTNHQPFACFISPAE